jgi:hypothetical protein
MNQQVLPMLRLETLVVAAGTLLRADVHLANDGPELADVVVEARFGDTASPLDEAQLLASDTSGLDRAALEDRFTESSTQVQAPQVPAFHPTTLGEVQIAAPDVPGNHDLVLRLTAAGGVVSGNRYPIHVVAAEPVAATARLVGGVEIHDRMEAVHALAAAGVTEGDGPLVVAEQGLDGETAALVRASLERGETVLLLAQGSGAAVHYPIEVTLAPVLTAWGSNVFPFTTDHGAIPSLPRRNILVGEDATVQATTVISSVDGEPFPDTPVVIAYKPMPGAMTGTIIGSHGVDGGRMIVCQYRLCRRVAEGDAAATAILRDVLRWACKPRPVMEKLSTTKTDGRAITSYSWHSATGR